MAELARGTVGDRPWGRTIATMAARGLTGQLNLYAPDGKVFQIAFEGGAITNAHSPLPADSAARVALTLQLIPSMQVQMLMARAQQQQRDEVDVIAEHARLPADHAIRLRRRTIATRAARTFAIEQGDFAIEDYIELPYFQGSELDSRGVIFMGASTLMTAERLAAEIARLGSYFQLKQEVIPELAQFGFTDSERPILEAMVQGAQLAALERIRDPRIVRSVVYALATAGACVDQAAQPVRTQQVARVNVRQVQQTPPPQPTAMPDTFTQARVAARAGGDGLEMPTLRREIKPGRVVKPETAAPPPTDDLLDLEAPTSDHATTRKASPTAAPQGRATFSNARPGYPPQPPDDALDLEDDQGYQPPYQQPNTLGELPQPRGAQPGRATFPPQGQPPPAAPNRAQFGGSQPNRTQFSGAPQVEQPPPAAPNRAQFGGSQPNRTQFSGAPQGQQPPTGSQPNRTQPANRTQFSGAPQGQQPPTGSQANRTQPPQPPNRTQFSGGQQPPNRAPFSPPPQAQANPRATLSPAPRPAFGSSNRPAQATTLPSAPTPRAPRLRTPQQQQVSTETQALISERIKLVDNHVDHFTMLGLKETATDEQIRKVYFQLARQLHPDKLAALGIADEEKKGQRLFAQVNTAFGVLSDPRRRQEYQAFLRKGGEAGARAEQQAADALLERTLGAEEAYERGKRALRQDAIQIAINEFKKASQLQPEEAEYMTLLAWSEFLASPDKLAVAQNTRGRFARAVQKAPQSATPRFYLARLERMLGRDAEALRVFEAVLQIEPNHQEAIAEVRVLKQRLKK